MSESTGDKSARETSQTPPVAGAEDARASRRLPQERLRELDFRWVELFEKLGGQLRRSSEAFVSWDGKGELIVSPWEELDPDDFLGQIILHELCHHFVEGPKSWDEPDWGLWNQDERDCSREHAALLLQARITSRFGLQRVFVATTDFRPFYEALPSGGWIDRASSLPSAHALSPPMNTEFESAKSNVEHSEAELAAEQGLRYAQGHPCWNTIEATLRACACHLGISPSEQS